MSSVRTLTFDKLTRLIRFHASDPLNWNHSVLGRIFKIQEDYCKELLRFVVPLVYYSRRKVGQVKTLDTSYVVDVKRLQTDKKYILDLQRLTFPKSTIDIKIKSKQPIEKIKH